MQKNVHMEQIATSCRIQRWTTWNKNILAEKQNVVQNFVLCGTKPREQEATKF